MRGWMTRRRSAVSRWTQPLSIAITTALLVTAAVAPHGTSAAPAKVLNLAASSFSTFDGTTHALASGPCGVNVSGTADATEYRGGIESAGGFTHNVQLPTGANITGFRLIGEDNDATYNMYAFLLQKKLSPRAQPFTSGYGVVASTGTQGAQAVVRRVSAASIALPVVQANFAYFAEIIACAGTVNPIGVQIVYTN